MASPPNRSPALELWGGVECSIVRVGSRVEDELARTGHDVRIEDLDRFAELGIRTLRYPVLWERHAGDRIDWNWADARLHRLRELGIRPIVGLLHHGCGPLDDGFFNPDFVGSFARFALAVAERYPWIDAFTPINEPLTTARFSGLYGLWHPHANDLASFARIFLNECQATRAAMRAIREITPAAQLVQTEDFGKTHSTPRLAYQAKLENERRWLTFDLLCGQLDQHRPMHHYLARGGISHEELDSFVEDPCPPDVIGMNYYVTSERFIDERLDRYPASSHGGNDHEAYADLPAARVRTEGLVGAGGLLNELWQRYQRPIAITETQLACTREEQLRWLRETWRAAQHAHEEGVDVRAVTAWSLLGAYDWDSLLRDPAGNYENGAFDIRSSPPRGTALADAIRDLATKGAFEHPALAGVGWWRRGVRLHYPAVSTQRTGPGTAIHQAQNFSEARPLLILGANGRLGNAFQRSCQLRGLHSIALTRRECDVTDPAAVEAIFNTYRPWAAVNATGYANCDDAQHDVAHCFRLNTEAAVRIAEACARHDCRLATFSCGQVFDGRKNRPYIESDLTAPLNSYGHSKQAAENAIASIFPRALVMRTGPLFGAWEQMNFAGETLSRLRNGEPVLTSADHFISPTYLPDFTNAALDLLVDGAGGIWHLANQGAVSWFEWARCLAEQTGHDPELVIAAPTAELGWTAPRPLYAALTSTRGTLLGPWENALSRYLLERAEPINGTFDHAPEQFAGTFV